MPDSGRKMAYFVRKMLDEYGFGKTELSFNEWLSDVSLASLGTARQASLVAGMLLALQDSPCDTAMIYDARCGVGVYAPLFNPLTEKPHKAYYAFMAFNELRKLGTAVPCRSSNAEVWACAARGDAGRALMVANTTDRAQRLQGVDLPGAKCRIVDAERTWEEIPVSACLPPHSIVLLTSARNDL